MPKMVSLASSSIGRSRGRPRKRVHPRGIRKNVVDARMAALRAVDSSQEKKGEAFQTEIACPDLDKVDPPPPSQTQCGHDCLRHRRRPCATGNPDNLRTHVQHDTKVFDPGHDTLDRKALCVPQGHRQKYINERQPLLPSMRCASWNEKGCSELFSHYFVTTVLQRPWRCEQDRPGHRTRTENAGYLRRLLTSTEDRNALRCSAHERDREGRDTTVLITTSFNRTDDRRKPDRAGRRHHASTWRSEAV